MREGKTERKKDREKKEEGKKGRRKEGKKAHYMSYSQKVHSI